MTTWAVALALGVGAASGARAAAVTVPAGLNPGDTYRIVFISTTTRDATSSNIADYNAHVTAAANLDAGLAGLGTTWAALASTETVNVLTNLLNEVGLAAGDSTTRFYNTAGQLVATGLTSGSTPLYPGYSTLHSATILTEAGDTPGANRFAWTGTTPDVEATSFYLGGSLAYYGNANSTDFQWTLYSLLDPSSATLGLYGVSGTITVPAAVPEPSTLALLGSALMALAFAKIRGVRRSTGKP